MVLRCTLILFFIPALCLPSTGSVTSGDPDVETIIKKVRERQMQVLEEVGDAVFMSETVRKDRKRDGKIKKEVVTRKRIYTRGSDKRYDEYLFMSINGRKLSKKEMEKEVEDDEKDKAEIKMPMTPEGEGAYDFHLIGSDNLDGVDVWVIEFKPKKKKRDYIDGKGYVSKDTFDIIRAEATLAKTPPFVKNLKASFISAFTQGYWMPAKFGLEITVELSFLYYKRITIEETYSGYKLNNNFDDSIFDTE
jgi:hypothetical protein